MVKLRFNEQTKDWDEMPKGKREVGSIYIDGILYKSFKNAKAIMQKKNIDLVVVVSGYPGSGKSKLVSQLASVCDPSFDEDRMYQSSAEFMEGVRNEEEVLKAHVLDEAWEGLSSSQVRKEIGRLFMSLMNTIRQKRLFIFIVLPDFFDLSKNIAIFRSRWLIHCYSESFGDVGRFVCFDRSSKKKLYLKGKQYEDYNAVKADFKGVFTNADAPNFNWARYEDVIKPRSMELSFQNKEADTKGTKQRNLLLMLLKCNHKYKLTHLAQLIGLDYKHLSATLKKFERTENLDFLKPLQEQVSNSEEDSSEEQHESKPSDQVDLETVSQAKFKEPTL